MSDEYQIRKDIDRIIHDLYTSENTQPLFIQREEFIEVLSNYYDQGKIDEIVADIVAGDIDLTDYLKKTDVDSEISSSSTYPLQNKVIYELLELYLKKSEVHDLDINLTTLELVDIDENPNGVICFEDLGSKYIEKSNTSGLVKNDGSIDTTRYLSSLPVHTHDDRYYTEEEIDYTLLDKQDKLVSGTNIKTINNTSLLGSGNIDIQGGGGSVIGTGSFSINNQGHLIVELPNGVDNPYFINNQGHLIYDTSNTHNGS